MSEGSKTSSAELVAAKKKLAGIFLLNICIFRKLSCSFMLIPAGILQQNNLRLTECILHNKVVIVLHHIVFLQSSTFAFKAMIKKSSVLRAQCKTSMRNAFYFN